MRQTRRENLLTLLLGGVGLALGAGCGNDLMDDDDTTNVVPVRTQTPLQSINGSNYLCKVEVDTNNIPVEPRGLDSVSSDSLLSQQFDPMTPPVSRSLTNILDGDELTVYFGKASHALDQLNDRRDLGKYASRLPNGTKLILEGFASFEGSDSNNLELSRNRAEGVRDFLYSVNPNLGEIVFYARGEEKASIDADPRLDRKVTLVPNGGVISRALAQVDSDVYVIDQSSSMGGNKWEQVQSHPFPKKSDVYTFTSGQRSCDARLSQQKPIGGTPLWQSLYDVLELTQAGKSVTLLTDGDNTVGGRSVDDIIGLAQKKNITVHVIGVGVYNSKASLAQIADLTGGTAYLNM